MRSGRHTFHRRDLTIALRRTCTVISISRWCEDEHDIFETCRLFIFMTREAAKLASKLALKIDVWTHMQAYIARNGLRWRLRRRRAPQPSLDTPRGAGGGAPRQSRCRPKLKVERLESQFPPAQDHFIGGSLT